LSRILLDTSAYSAFFRGQAELKRLLQEVDQIFVTPIVLGELKAGFAQGKRRKKNEEDLSLFLGSPRVEVLAIDEETAERYAVIITSLRSAGTPIPANDIWIAASAMQHGLMLATTDQHFAKVPQVIVAAFGPS
jgi:tRNA(fMet)-specific endonuclease VapC